MNRVEFFIEPVLRPLKFTEDGKQVFEDVEMIRIWAAGDRNTQWVGKVTREHKEEYRREYEAFKQGVEFNGDGYPIGMWAAITAPQAKHFLALGIRTVEELANISDSNLPKFGMGAAKIRNLAIRWLEEQSKSAPMTAFIQRAEAMDAKLAQQSDEIARLTALLAQRSAEPVANAPQTSNNKPLVGTLTPEGPKEPSRPMPEMRMDGDANDEDI